MAIEILADNLIIEVTRRCNMTCAHCLRGEAQNVDISTEILEMVAKSITPNCITFTGGEPALNVKAMETYMELAEKYGHMPTHFFVATNGGVNQLELALFLLKTYAKMDEPDMCALALSSDSFHDYVSPMELQPLEGLSFVDKEGKAHPHGPADDLRWVINTGRALEYSLGNRAPEMASEFVEDWVSEWRGDSESGFTVRMNEVYVSANGNVVDICDISYEDIDRDRICHISELQSVLMQYLMDEEAEIAAAVDQDLEEDV